MAERVSASAPSAGLRRLLEYSDAVVAMGVAGIVGMMIIPLPEGLLDILITVNIAGALVVLLVSMYTLEPLEFSVFPSLLLIATLFRLALNISATRLILLHAHAGAVIDSFGSFVVGGNYVVGIVVFLILVVVQFVVITNGAGRVAEVAARFTLDAMPGKQMSIDADMNAGLITEQQARQRRQAIEREADFYGAMDGATKFVKGDAIAGILIIFVNILGGLVIGILQLKMPALKALQTYTLLTIGDGLVSQIPALLLSTATGIIVTRAASESNLGRDVMAQVLANPRALGIVAGLLLTLALVPGLPKVPFLALAAILGVAYVVRRNQMRAPEAEPATPAQATPVDADGLTRLLRVDDIELELGYGLIPLADPDQAGNLLSRVGLVRRQIALELGFILPTIRIHDNMQLGANEYVIKLRGTVVSRGEAHVGHYLALNPGTAEGAIEGIPTTEPAFGLPALWIDSSAKTRAEIAGYTVVDPSSVITTHLIEMIKRHAASILSRQDVQSLVDNVKAEHPTLVSELVPDPLNVGDIHRVLQNLLREGVCIRDLVTILEALSEWARLVKEADVLSEHAREALGQAIVSRYVDAEGRLHAATIAPVLQQSLLDALEPARQGLQLNLEPARAQRLIRQISQEMEKMASAGHPPVLLCPGRLRLPLRRLTERSLPNLAILSYSEVPVALEVRPCGMVDDGTGEVEAMGDRRIRQ